MTGMLHTHGAAAWDALRHSSSTPGSHLWEGVVRKAADGKRSFSGVEREGKLW